jgi:hypothetical protein
MKIINFINTTSPQDEHACLIWFRFTVAIIGIAVIFIAYIQYTQIRLWYAYRQEYNQYNTHAKQCAQITEEKKKLATQEQTLKSKVQHINDTHNQCGTYLAQLNALQTLSNNTNFVSCALTPRGMEITLTCDTVEQAQICCNVLSKNTQSGARKMNLHIASIVPKKQVLQVILKN